MLTRREHSAVCLQNVLVEIKCHVPKTGNVNEWSGEGELKAGG